MARTPRVLHRVSSNVGWMSLNHLATMVVRLCYVLAAARMLRAEDYGAMAYSQSWYIAVFPLVLLGVSILFGREIGADRWSGLRLASATRRTRLMIAVGAALLIGIAATAVEPVSSNVALIIIFALTLVPRTMAVGSEGVLTGLELSGQTFANNLSWRTVELLFAVTALLAGAGIFTLAVIHVSSWSLQALNGLLRERRAAGNVQPTTAAGDAALTSVLFHDGLPLALGAFLTGLIGSGTLMLFRALCGAGDMLGALALFIQAIGVVLGFSVALGNALLPYLARTASLDGGQHTRALRHAMGFSLAAGGLASACLLLVDGAWIAALLGTGFTDVGKWLPGLGLFLTPILWHTLASRLFVSHASARRLLPIAGWGTFAALTAAFALIPAHGGRGALAAVLLGYLVQGALVSWAAATIVALRRRHIMAQLFAFLVLVVLTGAAMAEALRPAVGAGALVLVAMLAGARPISELARAWHRR